MSEVSEKTHVRTDTHLFSSFVRLECYEFSVPYGSLRDYVCVSGMTKRMKTYRYDR